MTKSLDPFRFLLIAVSGWMNQHQLQLIDYLREENRVLHEQWGQKQLRFNDDQRRRLGARAKGLGSKLLREVATIVAPLHLNSLNSSRDCWWTIERGIDRHPNMLHAAQGSTIDFSDTTGSRTKDVLAGLHHEYWLGETLREDR